MNNFLILNRAKALAIELSERGEVSMNTPPLSDNSIPGLWRGLRWEVIHCRALKLKKES